MILIAGGSGSLGTELRHLLAARGLPVRVMARGGEEAPGRVRADACDPGSLRPALEGVQTVVSAITGFGPGRPGPEAVDRDGNANLIAAAEAAGARRFVLLSMLGASPEHPMLLGRMKHAAEERLRASRLQWTIVRPTVFLELWAGILGDPLLRSGRATVFGRGDNPVNFVSVGDVARLVEQAVVDSSLVGQEIEIGGPEYLTVNQLVREIEVAAGRRATVRHVPRPLMRLARALLDPLRPDLAGLVEAGLVMDTVGTSFDAGAFRRRFPQIELTSPGTVVRERFAPGAVVRS